MSSNELAGILSRARYDSGSVEGSVIKESVLVGGMTVKGVEMGLVKRQEQHIRGFKADGIVGLAFPSISTTRNSSPSQHPTFVQLLQEQFGAAGDLFSVYLTRKIFVAGHDRRNLIFITPLSTARLAPSFHGMYRAYVWLRSMENSSNRKKATSVPRLYSVFLEAPHDYIPLTERT